MLTVGLTGGIATGKSQVLARLAAHGCATLDLDRLAHDVIAPGGPAYGDVVARFGPEIVGADGRIDRKRLGARVFADPAARLALNALVHPRVREEETRRVAALAAAQPGVIVVVDAALLVETGSHLRFDRLVVVDCDPALQLARLLRRDGLDEAAARARIASQMPGAMKRAFGHVVIDSNGDLDAVARQADALADELVRVAAARPAPAPVPLRNAWAALRACGDRGPRGLAAAELIRQIAADSGVELARIASRLVPPFDGPWYEAALAAEPGAGPGSLAVPVVLWALATRGPDADFVAAAAASIVRLTHLAPVDRANACHLALALCAAAAGRPPAVESVALATRWGGAAPTRAIGAAVIEAFVAGADAASAPADLACALERLGSAAAP